VCENETNRFDGGQDAGLLGSDTEETMGETPKVSLRNLLLCIGALSSYGMKRHRT